ncbi:hypothetical protein JG688_00007228 [Phytophthora aleatoria]|uniref:Uncharacterized protein n=1 Tax=Phytophthora aleatoria TaxID=2496075 RepID=A0A8J5J9Y9_9STRA|nr:hypothetical protein JG688_00007228 [Phytophthora aleatoria]
MPYWRSFSRFMTLTMTSPEWPQSYKPSSVPPRPKLLLPDVPRLLSSWLKKISSSTSKRRTLRLSRYGARTFKVAIGANTEQTRHLYSRLIQLSAGKFTTADTVTLIENPQKRNTHLLQVSAHISRHWYRCFPL